MSEGLAIQTIAGFTARWAFEQMIGGGEGHADNQ